MDDRDLETTQELISGLIWMHYLTMHFLEKSGAFQTQALIAFYEDCLGKLEPENQNTALPIPMRAVVERLKHPASPRWTPIVIPGGKAHRSNEQLPDTPEHQD